MTGVRRSGSGHLPQTNQHLPTNTENKTPAADKTRVPFFIQSQKGKTMSAQQFAEILFPDEVKPGDLEIVAPAGNDKPGRVKLLQARVGAPHPDAPSSAPLLSRSGGKIGFVAAANLIEPPYTYSYWLEAEISP
jgi:hypothetical protein